MLTAYKIVLIIIIVISFIGSIGERDDQDVRTNLTAICIASMISFLVSEVWL